MIFPGALVDGIDVEPVANSVGEAGVSVWALINCLESGKRHERYLVNEALWIAAVTRTTATAVNVPYNIHRQDIERKQITSFGKRRMSVYARTRVVISDSSGRIKAMNTYESSATVANHINHRDSNHIVGRPSRPQPSGRLRPTQLRPRSSSFLFTPRVQHRPSVAHTSPTPKCDNTNVGVLSNAVSAEEIWLGVPDRNQHKRWRLIV